VRLVDQDGNQVGVVATYEAKRIANDAGLDLVEVAPTARPPVCRIMDFGKYKYEQAKKAKESRKKQHIINVKEMRFRPKIEEHDFQFKTRHVRQFLEEGNKVRCFVLFRGRERAHIEFGERVLTRVAETLKDIATIEMKPMLEGRSMNMVLAPK
jgi:translation initiation factor IF-3